MLLLHDWFSPFLALCKSWQLMACSMFIHWCSLEVVRVVLGVPAAIGSTRRCPWKFLSSPCSFPCSSRVQQSNWPFQIWWSTFENSLWWSLVLHLLSLRPRWSSLVGPSACGSVKSAPACLVHVDRVMAASWSSFDLHPQQHPLRAILWLESILLLHGTGYIHSWKCLAGGASVEEVHEFPFRSLLHGTKMAAQMVLHVHFFQPRLKDDCRDLEGPQQHQASSA